MRRTAIALGVMFAVCGWTRDADAQTSQVATEYLMTLFAPLERYPIDGSTVVVNVKPGAGSRDLA